MIRDAIEVILEAVAAVLLTGAIILAIMVYFLLVDKAGASECKYLNSGHVICPASPRGAAPSPKRRAGALDANGNVVRYLPHPRGCPARAFCGCGASVRVFGHPVRSLYLARAWFKFPRASCAPGRVAVRSGHVFVIEQCNGDGTVLAADYNSGGHLSREHRRSLAGYTVVDPMPIRLTHTTQKPY